MNNNIKIMNVHELKKEFFGVVDKKPKGQKQSNFYLTVNSNVAVNNKDDIFAQKFRYVCKTFLQNIKRFIKPFEGFPGDDGSWSYDIVPIIEIGKKFHKIHMHCTIEIVHYSKIKLSLPLIRKFFAQNLTRVVGESSECHVFLKHYYKSRISDEDRIKSYIMKDDESIHIINEDERGF